MTDAYTENLIEIRSHVARAEERWEHVANHLENLNDSVAENVKAIAATKTQVTKNTTWIKLMGGAVGLFAAAGGILAAILQFVV